MGLLFIVTLYPFGTDLSHLLRGVKHVGVQHFRPIGPIEPFGERQSDLASPVGGSLRLNAHRYFYANLKRLNMRPLSSRTISGFTIIITVM